MAEPKELAERLEHSAELPSGNQERFAGFGVMGVPFASGDLLAMRRFEATSLGQSYTSVWHRDPQGRWTFYLDVPPQMGCPRYFGSAISETVVTKIWFGWSSPRDLTISIEGNPGLDWRVSMTETPATGLMNAVGGVLPDALWRKEAVLRGMGKAASVVLRAGRLGLSGRVPNNQRFMANPMIIWAVRSSAARLGDRDLGNMAPLPAQTRLGDFWIPQRGIFAIGRAFFEPLDPTRHALSTTAQSE
jgi:hypothetical protein